MQSYNNLLKNKLPLQNIRYSDKDIQSNLIFLPEPGNTIQSFLKTQIKAYYNTITIPAIINNFAGKKLSSQKHYLQMKKDLPMYKYNRVVSDEHSPNSSNILDLSGISEEILKLSKSRSKKLVVTSLIKFIESNIKDYNPSDDNILFIYNETCHNTDFLNLLEYIAIISGNRIKTDLTAIVYFYKDKHYPIAISHKDDKDESVLIFNKSIMNQIGKSVKNNNKTFQDLNDLKETITDLSNKISNSDDKEKKEHIQKIKDLVGEHPELKGNFNSRLSQLYSKDNITDTPIDQLNSEMLELNKKYNGNITIDVKSKDAIDPMKIVDMKVLGNYNKQEQELNENMDENIQDLIDSTLLQDKDLNIKVLRTTSRIVDDYNNRYKEYKIRIQHKDIGLTTNKPYDIVLRTPITVQGKYTRIGGNNYIMINQLFSAPITKVAPNLVRFYTHFGTSSLTLKSSHLNADKDFKDIEDRFITDLKSIKAVKLSEFTNDLKDDIVMKYKIPDLESFKYQKMEIAIRDYIYTINFNNSVLVDGVKQLRFYEKRSKKDNTLIEYATISEGSDKIKYKNGEGDISFWEANNINDFIFNIYNDIKIPGTDEKSSIMKKNKSSKPYYEIKIIGLNIPLGIFLLIDEESYPEAMNICKLDYIFSDKIDKEATVNIKYKLNNETKVFSLYAKNLEEEYIANSFNHIKIKDINTDKQGLEGIKECYLEALLNKYGPGKVYKILTISNRYIDGSTKRLLKDYGYNSTLGKVYAIDMVNMLKQRTPKSHLDLDNYRLRMSEAVTSLAFTQIQQALAKFKSTSQLSHSKIDIDNNYILDKLISAGILQYSKTLNPLEEAMLSLKVTKSGFGNMLKNQVTLNRRDINESYFGIIGPTSTNEYGGIGVNQTLTNGAIIDSRFGSIKKKAFNNNSNPFENLSPVESLSAFFEYDDTTRRVMGNQQTAQFTQLNNPDVPLVQTGFESYIPHLVSERFSKKAKKDGQVLEVTKDHIKIKYSDNSIDTINTKMVKSRTKRGIFIANEYNNLVTKGQKVKEGDLLSVSNSLKTGKLAIGRNLVVAEMGYLGMNYEDGWAVSDKLSEKYKNTILQKISIPYNHDSILTQLNLEEGILTKAGDILIEFTGHQDIESINDDEDEESDNVLVGLETRGKTKIYRSPGGRIKEIVVKINNKNINKKIIALHKKLTEPMRLKIERCKKEAGDKTQEYSDCIGHLENAESLVPGGHKLNQVEIDGAIIEVYIEQENPVRNGSKFTLTSSGGKGTVQYIMAHGKEPIAAETGLKIEFVGTSLSIVSRKNPSILLSMYLGKVIYFLNKTVQELAKQSKASKIKSLVLEVFGSIDKSEDKFILTQLNEFFKKPQAEIIKFVNSRDPLNNPAFPAIVPPFKNKITIKNIQEAADILGIPLNEKVIVVENDNIPTVKEVPVGILPVHMLEHFPKAMSSTRGGIKTGKNWITGQGRSGTAEGKGATKVGLYDMYSLTSQGSFGLLRELHSLKSDAGKAKRDMLRTITRQNRIPDEDDTEITERDLTSKNLVSDYFHGAGLEIEF